MRISFVLRNVKKKRELTHNLLKEIGVISIGHCLKILKHASSGSGEGSDGSDDGYRSGDGAATKKECYECKMPEKVHERTTVLSKTITSGQLYKLGSRGLKTIELRECKIDSGKLVYYKSKGNMDANRFGKFIDLSKAEVSSMPDKFGMFWIRIRMSNKEFREVAAKSKYDKEMWIVALKKAACAPEVTEKKKEEQKPEKKDEGKKTEAVKEKKPEKKEEAMDDSSDNSLKKTWEKRGDSTRSEDKKEWREKYWANNESHHKGILHI